MITTVMAMIIPITTAATTPPITDAVLLDVGVSLELVFSTLLFVEDSREEIRKNRMEM